MRTGAPTHRPGVLSRTEDSLGPADLSELFARNRAWVAAMVADDPRFFSDLAHRQAPEYL